MKIKSFFSIFIFSIFVIFFFYFSSYIRFDSQQRQVKTIEEKLHQLVPQEKEYLDNFFHYLIRISCFGYILFGDKPMGIEFIDYGMPTKSIEGIDYMDKYHLAYKYRFKEGWETWKKYKELFPTKNFIFFDYPHSWNKDYKVICLINKSAFLNTIQENINDFHSVLGNNMSPEQILEDYVHQGNSFKIINSHDGLFGTLLGYGRENSWYFKNQESLDTSSFVSFVDDCCQENHEELYMNLPGFKALRGHKETNELVTKYKQQKTKIENQSLKEGFLLPSLKKITAN